MNIEFVEFITQSPGYAYDGDRAQKHNHSVALLTWPWWDALIIQSASHLGAAVVWSEDLADGGRFGTVQVRSPFR